jgi:hypothetical protein
MPYYLHTVDRQGAVAHAHFSQLSWEAAMGNPELSRFWGHGAECADPQDHPQLVANRVLRASPEPPVQAPPKMIPTPGLKKKPGPTQGSLFDFDGG